MNNTGYLWKNLWTSLWDSMWEKCGKNLWKTTFCKIGCVKAWFSTQIARISGKVSPLIYTYRNREKWRVLHTFHTPYYCYY